MSYLHPSPKEGKETEAKSDSSMHHKSGKPLDYDHLEWTTAPQTINNEQPFSTYIEVSCWGRDSGMINPNYTGSITIELDNNPNQSASISGNVALCNSGTATFPTLMVWIPYPVSGQAYPLTLIAYSSFGDTNKVYSAESLPFNVLC